MIWIEKGFVVVCWRDFFFIIILSQLTAVDLRGGEALGVPKAVSPPRAPPLRPRNLLQVVGMCMFIGGAMDSTVLSVVRCADFYSLWTKCGLLGRPVSVVSWDLFCL